MNLHLSILQNAQAEFRIVKVIFDNQHFESRGVRKAVMGIVVVRHVGPPSDSRRSAKSLQTSPGIESEWIVDVPALALGHKLCS
jgi:hypothetical protein